MIANVFMIHVRRLFHSRVELMLTFVVPVAFFSIFALIFAGGVGGATTPKIKVAIVDAADTPVSAQLVKQLESSESLRLMRDEPPSTIDPEVAADWVRGGSMTMAIVVRSSDASPGAVQVELLTDSSDQVATQVVSAVVSQSLARLQRGGDTGQRFAMRNRDGMSLPTEAVVLSDVESMIRVVDILGEDKSNPVISMYAAGIAVMFLLFGASGGGGTLLEEKENQTLDRLLSTQMTMDQLLLGKWVYLTVLGLVQVTVMFAWAGLVFGVDILGHFDGFLMMTLVTSSAAASLGLFLATLCKTRGQLNGLSVILILTMSALGGSMVPRYIMSESLRKAGLWTFNAWALDGYDKVFWRELPVEALAPQMTVLMLSGVGLLMAARLLAIRWETE